MIQQCWRTPTGGAGRPGATNGAGAARITFPGKLSGWRSTLLADTRAACWIVGVLALMGLGPVLSVAATDQRTVIVVGGAAGEERYVTEFNSWATNWVKAAGRAHAKALTVGFPILAEEQDSNKPSTEPQEGNAARDELKRLLDAEPKDGTGELWLVLIGHGTFNGKEAKFNLRGADFSATELAEWLKPIQRPQAILNCASSSAPFINALASTNRIVAVSTRSGYEINYARFGKFLSEAIGGSEGDLDKDGQTSLLEAFIMASKKAVEFYKNEERLATEHGLLDDNGDGHGTPADWFRGVRAQKKPAQGSSLDGARAHQWHLVRSMDEENLDPATRARRDKIELAVNKLRDRKSELPEQDYYKQLEALLLDMARIYGKATNSSALPSSETAR